MASNAIETAKQENCSRLFFQYYIEKNIELSIEQLAKTITISIVFQLSLLLIPQYFEDIPTKKGIIPSSLE